MKSGSFFSNEETELRIKNITQVLHNIPYIQSKIFGTGNVFIKAAGSGEVEITLTHLNNSNKIFKTVQELMINNGFTLSKEELIQKEKPNNLAVFLEVIRNFVIGLFIAYFAIITTLVDIINFSETSLIPFITLLLIIAIGLIFVNVFRYMNLMRKTYYLYKDTVYYEDLFFTRNYSYIPIENLSDSELTQGFITKLLELYNLRISSQGQGNEILFYYIENGEAFDNNLDKLINETKPVVKEEKKEEKTNKVNETSYYTTKVMDMTRTLSSTLINYIILLILLSFTIFVLYSFLGSVVLITLFAIPFVLLFLTINVVKDVIDVLSTKFNVNKNSVERNYSFLTSSNVEFSNEKITMMKIKRDLYDKFFNTLTISFFSIGSSSELEFKNIKEDSKLVNEMLKKINVPNKNKEYERKASFSFIEMLKANPLITLLSALLVIITPFLGFIHFSITLVPLIIILAYLLIYFYKKIYYSKSLLQYYKDNVYFKRGLIIREEYYSNYNQIKDLYSKKYPFSKCGTFNVISAGEIIKNDQNGQGIAFKVGFKMSYLDNIMKEHDFTDKILAEKHHDKANFKVLKSAKPSFANPLTITYAFFIPLIILSLTLPTLLTTIILPIIVITTVVLTIITIIKTRRKTYFLDGFRAVFERGVLFRIKKSVLYIKMDHMSKDNQFLNKIYNNGNIKVFTTGSSMPELVIKNIKERDNFYKLIESNYR